ncbi:MAG: hypothetical protein FJ217_12595 [Ignavibacteria bacterium]|nr:hypothetical protein [Ignavibacteria bacterium]
MTAPQQPLTYQESAPMADRENPSESMMERFDIAAYIPADAGGPRVSYFEWIQNRVGHYWSLDRANSGFERIMREAIAAVCAAAVEHKISLRIGGYVLAIDRVARTLKLRGRYG